MSQVLNFVYLKLATTKKITSRSSCISVVTKVPLVYNIANCLTFGVTPTINVFDTQTVNITPVPLQIQGYSYLK